MSRHNGPRINAIREILLRTDLSPKEKENRIEKLNKSFGKIYRKLDERSEKN